MWPLSLIWFLLACFCWFLLSSGRLKLRLDKNGYFWVMILTFISRLILVILARDYSNFDLVSYQLVAETVASKEDVYLLMPDRFPYLPLWLYFSYLARLLHLLTKIPFSIVIKLFPIMADVGIALLIFKSLPQKSATLAALGFALNPFSVMITSYNGAFTSIPLFFSLLAWRFWMRRKLAFSSLALSLGVLFKTWPIIFLPLFLFRLKKAKEKLFYLLPIIALPLLAILAYILVFQGKIGIISRTILSYQAGPGNWGWTMFFYFLIRPLSKTREPFLRLIAPGKYLFLIILALVFILQKRKGSLIKAMLFVILTIYVFTFGFAGQYFAWIIPFALLAGSFKRLFFFCSLAIPKLIVGKFGAQMLSLFMPPSFLQTVILIGLGKLLLLILWFYTIFWWWESCKKETYIRLLERLLKGRYAR